MLIPFVLLTDVYPFFRFGMFAEPVRRNVQLEQFTLRYVDNQGNKNIASAEQVGLGSLAYLLRNYYYRNQTEQLLESVHELYPDRQHVREWQLLRITASVRKPDQTDTTAVATWQPPSQPAP